ncbi:MAG: C25 family cysteine peptidase, partial [Candidatus Zixiibacteriota bacterium]
YDIIRMKGHSYLNIPGAPMLPSKSVKIAVPDGFKIETVEIANIQYEEISGSYNIFPAQNPIEIGADMSDYEFIKPDENIYKSSSPYPVHQINFIRQADLAGQSFAVVDIYPVRYLPLQANISLITEITLTIKGSYGYICGDYLPAVSSAELEQKYKNRLENIVENSESVSLKSSPVALKSISALPDGAPFEHVIITNFFFEQLYEPLTTWHTRKGLRDTVITIEYIYSNYDGVDNKEKIRNFIIDAHQNWGTSYFLLAGELSVIPFGYRSYDNTVIPSDMYYADYDDDWEYEAFLGRITSDTQGEAEKFVDKILTYEINPPDLNFLTDITLLGMDLTINAPPDYVLTRGQWLMDSIDVNYLPANMTLTRIYDTDSRNHLDDFKAALNDGQNLINHCDHSNYNVMCTGDRNHGWCFSSWDVFSLTNYRKYSNIVSIGCYANEMDHNDAISEYFIFATDSSGAVSFTGNTRSGWFYLGDPMSLSSELNYNWWIGLFEQGITNLGDLLAYCKDVTNIDVIHPFSDWTLNLLGDPAQPLWTGMLIYPAVTHSAEAEAISQQMTIHVGRFGNINVEGATVCLWKGSEIYQKVLTGTDGNATFDIYPTTNGTIYVTATKGDMYPYLGEIEVVGNVPPQCLTPGDTTILQCFPEEVSLPVGCVDPDGNLQSGPTLAKGPGQIIDNYWRYTPSGDETVEITIGCTDSEGFNCETTFWVTFIINVAPELQLPADSTVMDIYPPTEIILPVSMIDMNGTACYVSEGPGVIENGYWKYTPTDDENCGVTITATDDCGLNTEGSFNINYQLYKCGDADDNLTINILDITYNINFLYKGGSAPDPIIIGDADGNGTINILDITYLISYLYKSGPEPICH